MQSPSVPWAWNKATLPTTVQWVSEVPCSLLACFQLAGGALWALDGETSCTAAHLGLALAPVKCYAVLRRSCDQITDEACCPRVPSAAQGWQTFL